MTGTTFDFATYFDFARINDVEYLAEKNITKYQKDDLVVLKYKKNALNTTNVSTLGHFRSVIYNTKTKSIVSYSPAKSYSLDDFNKAIDFDDSKIQYEEFVEGTMINLFYSNDEWQMATRSLLGGRGLFFKGGKTFRQMFLECTIEKDIDFESFNQDYCYSFVIQHSDNRIVTKFTKPDAVLCAVYKCDGSVVEEVSFDLADPENRLTRPRTYTFESIEEAKKVLANADSTPYYVQGVVMKCNGVRSKIRNPNYEYVRRLRGNQPKTQYQYLSLRKSGKVGEFLKYYPEFAQEFQEYRSQVHYFTSNLHTNYINCYVKKMMRLGEFPKEFRQHMYIIHQTYINELIPKMEHVSREFVINYVNNIHTPHLMYAINFKHRQQKLDEQKTKTVEAVVAEAAQ